MTARLGHNDLVPCPSPESQKRHSALAEHCAVCGTEGRTVPVLSLQALVARRRELRTARGAA